MEDSIGVLKALYNSGSTKAHAVDLVSALYPNYGGETVQTAIDSSKLRFRQAPAVNRFSDEFVKAAVLWVMVRQHNSCASKEETAMIVGPELLAEISKHCEDGFMPNFSVEEITRSIAGAQVAIDSGAAIKCLMRFTRKLGWRFGQPRGGQVVRSPIGHRQNKP